MTMLDSDDARFALAPEWMQRLTTSHQIVLVALLGLALQRHCLPESSQ